MLDGEPYPDGRRRQVRSTHRTLTAARGFVTAHRTDLDRGVLLSLDRRNRASFASFADSWVAAREGNGHIRANTAVGYRSALRRANSAFGSKSVADVTDTDVESMARAIAAAGRTQRSCAFTLFVVRAVFKEAMRRRLIARNPAEFVEGVRTRLSASRGLDSSRTGETARPLARRSAIRVLAADTQRVTALRGHGTALVRRRHGGSHADRRSCASRTSMGAASSVSPRPREAPARSRSRRPR